MRAVLRIASLAAGESLDHRHLCTLESPPPYAHLRTRLLNHWRAAVDRFSLV